MSHNDTDGWDPERVDAISFERSEKDPNAPLALALMVAANDLYFEMAINPILNMYPMVNTPTY